MVPMNCAEPKRLSFSSAVSNSSCVANLATVCLRALHQKADLELVDGLSKFGNLRSLIVEKEIKELVELGHVVDVASNHFLLVFKNDVVLRVTAPELECYLVVEIVLLILRFPIAKRHAQLVQQRAIDQAAILGGRDVFVFRHKDQLS